MHFDRGRVPLLVVIIVAVVGALLATSVVSLAGKALVNSEFTVLPGARCAMDIGGSYLIQVQTRSVKSLTSSGNVTVTAHFAGTYYPIHLQTMSITMDEQTTVVHTDNVGLTITDADNLDLIPQLGMDHTERLTFAAYGFTITLGMKSVVTVDHVDLAAETADFHAAYSETVGAEFGYPHTPSYPGEVLPGVNFTIGGSIRYPWSAPRSWFIVTAHSNDADITATTDVELGKMPAHTTVTAAVRMDAITLSGNVSLSLIPYRVTGGMARVTVRWGGLSLAVTDKFPTSAITVTLGYQFQV